MSIPAYLKERRHNTFSKYHRIQDGFPSSYPILINVIISKFHRWSKEYISSNEESKLDLALKDDYLSHEIQSTNLGLVATLNDLPLVFKGGVFENRLDWTRGRISGLVISLKVKEGNIIEKTFLTSQGNRVVVRRNELGLTSFLPLLGIA